LKLEIFEANLSEFFYYSGMVRDYKKTEENPPCFSNHLNNLNFWLPPQKIKTLVISENSGGIFSNPFVFI